MPRPATFNAEVILERTMLLFWTKGYAGTSIQDLVEGTELLRGSLYGRGIPRCATRGK